jgi:hypothetical protein
VSVEIYVRPALTAQDLAQIEDWNEVGELKEQIKATDDLGFGSGTASTPAHANTINPRGLLRGEPPPPANPPVLTSPPVPSNPSSRASSQGRHISIEEPSAKEKERDRDRENKDENPSEAKAKSPVHEAPQNLLLKQLGAEAAARAKDRKTSATKPAPAAVPVTSPTDTTSQIPSPVAVKSEETELPSTDPEITAAKTPAALAEEGKTKTTTEKIDKVSASTSPGTTSDDEGDKEEKSTEEQLLAMRRSSTQVAHHSSLSKSMSVDDTAEDDPDAKEDETKAGAAPEAEGQQTEKAAEKSSEQEAQSEADIKPSSPEVAKAVPEPEEEPPVKEEPTPEPETKREAGAKEEPIADPEEESAQNEAPVPQSEPKTDQLDAKPEAVTDTRIVSEPSETIAAPEEPDASQSKKRTSSSSLKSALSQTNQSPEGRRSHRGSSLEEVDKEAIKKAEEAIRIQEEEEDEEDEDSAISRTRAAAQRALEANATETPISLGGLAVVDEKEERILRNAQVKIGKDVGSDENMKDKEAIGRGPSGQNEKRVSVSAAPEASSTATPTPEAAPARQIANDAQGGESEHQAATNLDGGAETTTSIAGPGSGASEVRRGDDEDEDDGQKDERQGKDDDEIRAEAEKQEVRGSSGDAKEEHVSGRAQEDGQRRSTEQETVDDAAGSEQKDVDAVAGKQVDGLRSADGDEEEANVDAKLVDEKKEKALKEAEVELPSGKETDIEGLEGEEKTERIDEDAKGTAKDPEEASKTVGD